MFDMCVIQIVFHDWNINPIVQADNLVHHLHPSTEERRFALRPAGALCRRRRGRRRLRRRAAAGQGGPERMGVRR